MTFWHKIWSKICIPYSLYSNFLCLVHFIYTNYRLNDVHFEIFRLHKVMSLFWRVLLNSKECFQQTFRIEMKCKSVCTNLNHAKMQFLHKKATSETGQDLQTDVHSGLIKIINALRNVNYIWNIACYLFFSNISF